LKYVDLFNEQRRRIADQYTNGLKDIEGLVLPSNDAGHVFHQYTLRILNGNRERLQHHLQSIGIGSMIYYPVPLHKMKVFENRMQISESLRNAETACKEVLSLPMEPLQGQETTEYIVQSVCEFFKDLSHAE
jgi:dTDP-4-amino-4,6-dideoxygalactose transaminase